MKEGSTSCIKEKLHLLAKKGVDAACWRETTEMFKVYKLKWKLTCKNWSNIDWTAILEKCLKEIEELKSHREDRVKKWRCEKNKYRELAQKWKKLERAKVRRWECSSVESWNPLFKKKMQKHCKLNFNTVWNGSLRHIDTIHCLKTT